MTGSDTTAGSRLRHLLVSQSSEPRIALVAGRAGTGKTRLVERLLELPQSRARSALVLAFTASGEAVKRVERPLVRSTAATTSTPPATADANHPRTATHRTDRSDQRAEYGTERADRADRLEHLDRPDRVDRMDRVDRTDRPERADRPDRTSGTEPRPCIPGARTETFAPDATPAAPHTATTTAPTPPSPATLGALAALGDLAAATDPVLLVAEDVHRADPAALALLTRLLTKPPAGLVAVLTYRPEELPEPGLPLGGPVDYPAEAAVIRIPLEPLTEEQIAAYAAEVLGAHRCSAEFTARLHQRSGGVAQVAADLLRALDDGGKEPYGAAEVDAVGVPVRLAELIAGRIRAIPAEHRPVVWAAGVLGEPAPAHELAAVAGVPLETGRAGLLAAEAAGVLRELDRGRYGFDVPLAAHAVHDLLPGTVREDMHRRAARTLGRRQPVPWARLARHHRHGGRTRDWLRAVERAAEQYAAGGRHMDAIVLLDRTLSATGIPQHHRVKLALLLARSAVIALRVDETVGVMRHIVEDVDLPTEVRGEMRLDLALLLSNTVGLGEGGRAELTQAAEELESRPDLAARAMSALAMPYWPGPPLEANLRWLERAEEAAKESGNLAVQMAVAANRATVMLNIGAPGAWQLVEQLPRDTEELAARQQVARGVVNAADCAYWLGEYATADALLAEGRELASRTGASGAHRTGRSTELLLRMATGQWAALSEHATAYAIEVGEDHLAAVDANLVRALLALARGDWSTCFELLTGNAVSNEERPVPLGAAASALRIRLALARREPEAAAEEAELAWGRLRAKGVWAWAADLAPWAVEAQALTGRRERAAQWVTEFAEGVEGRPVPVATASLARARAALAESAEEHVTAAELFREAAESYEALPRPYEAALAREAAGRCALAAGGRETSRGVDELTAAARVLDDLAAVWDAARVRATLRTNHQAPDRRPPGRPGYGDRLSPREREVAVLAGRGLTNREIAETLHLSSRTVEQHVARALRKLGAHSRQDLAQAAEAQGPEQGQ
ncbi:AAA family ATPase [Streptomyces sp. NA04227]|uniref:helix-turn-helix transcriptional regulator n=1 Tax=Streptomyces sp. NA04227 TaxID=2742136 RepID=UPI0015901F8D|nr:LuxR family transcriptional regulator [Streptomyces sp. NA04227]QKW06548.1 AAA family ATPase [Streptomyces sp. NA04227]